jgi:hypothetical protein
MKLIAATGGHNMLDQPELLKFLMVGWIAALIVAWSLIASSVGCFGQQAEDFPDSSVTREQWQQRVENARRRSEEFVANARTKAATPPPSEKEEAQAADQRAMNDPSLQHGDIIATDRGCVVFVGRDEEHQPNDFLPTVDLRHQPPGAIRGILGSAKQPPIGPSISR